MAGIHASAVFCLSASLAMLHINVIHLVSIFDLMFRTLFLRGNFSSARTGASKALATHEMTWNLNYQSTHSRRRRLRRSENAFPARNIFPSPAAEIKMFLQTHKSINYNRRVEGGGGAFILEQLITSSKQPEYERRRLCSDFARPFWGEYNFCTLSQT